MTDALGMIMQQNAVKPQDLAKKATCQLTLGSLWVILYNASNKPFQGRWYHINATKSKINVIRWVISCHLLICFITQTIVNLYFICFPKTFSVWTVFQKYINFYSNPHSFVENGSKGQHYKLLPSLFAISNSKKLVPHMQWLFHCF